MKTFTAILLALSIALSLAACSAMPKPEETPEKPAETPSEVTETPEKPGETPDTPVVAAPETPVKEPLKAKNLTAGLPLSDIDWTFDGLDYSDLDSLAMALISGAEGENPVVSPLSAYAALAMAAEGADGETLAELENVVSADRRRELYIILDRLASDGCNTFKSANSAWVSFDASIREEYLRDLVAYYHAEVYATDFDIAPMNAWIEENTNGLIKDMFREPLDPLTRLVLINTLYMKAEWASPFEEFATYENWFYTENGEKTVEFMHKTEKMAYISGEGCEGVSLKYKGGGVEFIALKPIEGTARELIGKLDLNALDGESRKIRLSLPKFTAEYETSLVESLQKLGVELAFTDDADFSPMSEEPLKISAVRQKVKVIVDEEGTEAAAATVIEMNATSAAPGYEEEPYVLDFDEPFVYIIADAESHAPLFMGVMDDPTL